MVNGLILFHIFIVGRKPVFRERQLAFFVAVRWAGVADEDLQPSRRVKINMVQVDAKALALLDPRFKIISSLMDTIQILTMQNALFETEIKELGAKNNILSQSTAADEIAKGLAYLKNEGWLSEKEYDAIREKIP